MKRAFCALMVMCLFIVNPADMAKAAGLATIVSVAPDKNYAYVYEDITYSVSIANTQVSNIRYDYFVIIDGKEENNSLLAGNTKNLGTNMFKVYCIKEGDYQLGCRVVQNRGERYTGFGPPPDMISPVTKVAWPLEGGIVYPDKTSAKTGEVIAWTSTAYDGFAPLKYNWNIMCDGNTVMACSGLKTSKTLTCPADKPGIYTAEVWIQDAAGTNVYAKCPAGVPVSQGLAIKSVEPSKKIAKTGEDIRWTAIEVIGGAGYKSYQFSFDVYRDNALVQKNPWNKSINYTWKPDKPGNYTAMGYVSDGKDQAAAKSAVTRVANPLAIVSVKANRTGAPVGAEIIWTTTTAGGIDPLYSFDLFKDSQYLSGSAFGKSNAYTWTAVSAGSCRVTGSAFDVFGDMAKQDSAAITVSASSKLAVKSVHVDRTTAAVGEKITWTAAAMGGSGGKSYQFEVYRNDVKLSLPAAFTASSTYSHTPASPGKYKAAVYVKDPAGSTTSPVYSQEILVQALVPFSADLPYALPVYVSLPPDYAPYQLPDQVVVQAVPEPTAMAMTAAPKTTAKPPVRTVTPKPAATGPTPAYLLTATPVPTATIPASILTPEPIIDVPVTPAPAVTFPLVYVVPGLILPILSPTPGID